jgi:hypothetical protein
MSLRRAIASIVSPSTILYTTGVGVGVGKSVGAIAINVGTGGVLLGVGLRKGVNKISDDFVG